MARNSFVEVDFSVANEHYESIMRVDGANLEELRQCKIQFMYVMRLQCDFLLTIRKLKSQLFQSVFGVDSEGNGDSSLPASKWWIGRPRAEASDPEFLRLEDEIFTGLGSGSVLGGVVERKDKLLIIECLRYSEFRSFFVIRSFLILD